MAREAHASDMKPYFCEEDTDPLGELFHFLPTYRPVEVTPGEWDLDKVLRHRKGPDGKLQFLTRWEGAGPNEETWEPVSNFINRYCYELVQYCKNNKLSLDLVQYLKPYPYEGPVTSV